MPQHDLDLIFDSINCTKSDRSGLLKHHACSVGKNPKRPSLNMELEFSRAVAFFELNMLISIPRKPKNFVLLNVTKMNGCNLLSNNNLMPLLQMGRTVMERYSNFPNKCPFLKDTLYYIKGLRINMDLLPAFNFETTMNTASEWIVEKKKMLSVDMSTRVAMKTKKNVRPK